MVKHQIGIRNKAKKIIIILILIAYILIWLSINNRIRKEENRIDCKTGRLYAKLMVFDNYNPSNVNKSKVYALDRKTGNIVDSTSIVLWEKDEFRNQNISFNSYSFRKPLSTSTDWKIILKDGTEILISDIITNMNIYYAMFDTVEICEIVEWKVNGKLYTMETDGSFRISKD